MTRRIILSNIVDQLIQAAVDQLVFIPVPDGTALYNRLKFFQAFLFNFFCINTNLSLNTSVNLTTIFQRIFINFDRQLPIQPVQISLIVRFIRIFIQRSNFFYNFMGFFILSIQNIMKICIKPLSVIIHFFRIYFFFHIN